MIRIVEKLRPRNLHAQVKVLRSELFHTLDDTSSSLEGDYALELSEPSSSRQQTLFYSHPPRKIKKSAYWDFFRDSDLLDPPPRSGDPYRKGRECVH